MDFYENVFIKPTGAAGMSDEYLKTKGSDGMSEVPFPSMDATGMVKEPISSSHAKGASGPTRNLNHQAVGCYRTG